MGFLAHAVFLIAAALPWSPHPAPPFPAILTDAPTFTRVAPGVQYGDYQMLTADGPLWVHVVSVDTREPTVHLGTALAQQQLISHGETVSSMARRTGAVAGINGDYFDINQTNQPLNVLVQDGRLLHAPSHRSAVAIHKDGTVQFAEFSLGMTLHTGDAQIPLQSMNDWWSGASSVLFTPEFGPLPARANVTEIALQPLDGTPPFATYRVVSVADNSVAQPAGYYLAIGPNSYGAIGVPNEGDTISITDDSRPAFSDVVSAVGGGPLLVKDGAWYADPDGPSNGEFKTHMPATAVALTRDGRLLFFVIDGRQPALSIGVLQPQLAALMISFGAVTGMQLDGGGSSTIVVRDPGDAAATVANSPSDGVERRVGDGLFVYSDAPYGPPSRLYASPQTIRALPGARVPVKIAVTDAAGHPVQMAAPLRIRVIPASAGAIDGGDFVAAHRDADAVLRVERGDLKLDVPVHVTSDVARTQIVPIDAALRAGERVQLQARAYDERGYPIAVPATLPWHTLGGSIDGSGAFHAGASDAAVSVRLGNAIARERITVGEHEAAIALAANARFATVPSNGPGSLTATPNCAGCLTLRYDFTGSERAAYARAPIPLPQRALGLAADVYGDGKGEILRVGVNNAIDERFRYTMATVNWHGWRRVEVRFPAELPQPLTLESIYVINLVGPGTPVKAAGAVALRHVRVILAGSAASIPK